MKFKTKDQRIQDFHNDPKNNIWTKCFAWLPVTITTANLDHTDEFSFTCYIYWLCFVERRLNKNYDWKIVWEYREIENE